MGLVLPLLLLGAPGGARAQQDEEPTLQIEDQPAGPQQQSVIIVDLQRVLREALSVQALQAQISAAREAFQAEIRQREEVLRQLDQDLAKERPNLSPEDYAERKQALADELASLQSAVQTRRRQLDQAMNEGMRQVQTALLPIIQALAEERGADLVLVKTSIVLARPGLEITDAALERLNEVLPTVNLQPGE